MSCDPCLCASCVELQADGMRYRWLRGKAFWESERDMAPGGRWYMIVIVDNGHPSVDAAIDARRVPSASALQSEVKP